MLDTVINYIDKFAPEVLVILFGLLVILSTLFLWLWFSNRRKYHNLKHAIPANIVKNYLDSIIQNSTALKSSLFRGGGLDLGNVPSVMSLGQLVGGEGLAISGAPSTALLEELNHKKALLASLEAQLSSLQAAHRELEAKHGQGQQSLTSAEAKIRELEALLAELRKGSNGDEALKSELSMVLKERDEIRDRLKEFEIISDDLANLKRLQQENEQLKRSLAAGNSSLSSAPAVLATLEEKKSPGLKAEVADLFEDLDQTEGSSDDTSALEDFLSSPDDSVASAPMEQEQLTASSEDSDNGDDKQKAERTPEDLLSEFEKMLG